VDKWEDCFSLPSVKIPSVAYLGFTAETGELSDNHDLISVSTKNLYAPSYAAGAGAGREPGKKGRKKVKSSGGGSWAWLFFKFILFGVVVAGSYVGYTAYRTSKSRSRF
jgi:lectin, mannose-binding 2